MEIPLAQFEHFIDETILKRGLQYFKKGLVSEPEEIAPGEIEAIVDGTDRYTVRLTIKNDILTDYYCSCPYDLGPVCKHTAAVLFYLHQEDLNITAKPAKERKKTERSSRKKKTILEQIQEILDKISTSELKAFVGEQCDQDFSFRQLFYSRYASLVVPDSRELYAKQIRALFKSHGRHPYLSYSESRKIGQFLNDLIVQAEYYLEREPAKALHISMAVIEEMSKDLLYIDDSSGDLGSFASCTLDILHKLSKGSLPEILRQELFKYCTSAFTTDHFKGFGWHFTLLDIAIEIVNTPEEIRLLHELIGSLQSKKNDDQEEAQELKLHLIEKTEDPENALRFLNENLDNYNFRKKLIDHFISQNDYTKAISLAEDGIKKTTEKSPGYAHQLQALLLKIHIKMGEKDKVISLARILFLDNYSKDYYKILKNHVVSEEWTSFVEELIETLKKKRGYHLTILADIYLNEGYSERMLNLLQQAPSLSFLDKYSEYLMNDYHEEINQLYHQVILNHAQESVGRDHYQFICKYLRRMIKSGERARVNFIIEQLRSLYPKRKALMEELDRV